MAIERTVNTSIVMAERNRAERRISNPIAGKWIKLFGWTCELSIYELIVINDIGLVKRVVVYVLRLLGLLAGLVASDLSINIVVSYTFK